MEKYPELPNIIALLTERFEHASWSPFLRTWENVIYAALAGCFIVMLVHLASRKLGVVPGRLQAAVEFYVESMSGFVHGLMGPKGAAYIPFIGTLFIYILTMNLMGYIPFLKSPTSSLSTTVALALCVFIYVQYTAFKELGLRGYIDHLLGKPRGAIAWSVFIPALMFVLHFLAELLRPVTLSLRLRSNIWGDDMLLAIFTGFGFWGLPLLFFNMLLTLLAAVIQAFVFTLLTSVYFALILTPEEE